LSTKLRAIETDEKLGNSWVNPSGTAVAPRAKNSVDSCFDKRSSKNWRARFRSDACR
jgi:hypothetical protein